MLKLVLALLVVMSPMVASAAEDKVVPSTSPDRAPKSFLNANDIFHFLAHTCDVPFGGTACGPDNVVFNPFTLLIQFDAPFSQSYTRHWLITDTEGKVEFVQTETSFLPAGTQTLVLQNISLPNSADVFSRGLYKFLSIVIGANGNASISNYYPFRVRP